MSQPIFVHIDIQGSTQMIGQLWHHTRGGRQSTSFEYASSWLTCKHRFSLEPALALGAGSYHTRPGKQLFGAIGDSSPDRWGRILMRRKAKHDSTNSGQTQRYLSEIDYLLQVNDILRQGALRFSMKENSAFLAQYTSSSIPPLIDLARLLAAADNISANRESDDDIRLLLAPGSSLGGARPKSSVIDKQGNLLLAKFPSSSDEISTEQWEAVALALAGRAGISVPEWQLKSVTGRKILLLKRFDRIGSVRIPFISAMSMIDSSDNETRSYLELADSLTAHGARSVEDKKELWRRIVFTVLISNVDDHMRNHGFLHTGTKGWILSPAYDMNPTPADMSPRILSTAINYYDTAASLEIAFEVAEYFGINPDSARQTATEVGCAVKQWRKEANRFHIPQNEIDRMESAFEHRDLAMALGNN